LSFIRPLPLHFAKLDKYCFTKGIKIARKVKALQLLRKYQTFFAKKDPQNLLKDFEMVHTLMPVRKEAKKHFYR